MTNSSQHAHVQRDTSVPRMKSRRLDHFQWKSFGLGVSCASTLVYLISFNQNAATPSSSSFAGHGGHLKLPIAVRVPDDAPRSIDEAGTHRNTSDDWNDANAYAMAETIAARWNLTQHLAVPILYEQMTRLGSVVTYSQEEDLLMFFHPMKTGGTSLSLALHRMFGDEAVVPGSHASDFFDIDRAIISKRQGFAARVQSIEKAKAAERWWRQKRILYSHTPYFAFNGTEASTQRLQQFLSRSNKIIKLISMLREPVNVRASNVHEWMCHVDTWVKHQQRDTAATVKPRQSIATSNTSSSNSSYSSSSSNHNDTGNRIDDGCPNVNLTQVTQWRHRRWRTRTELKCRRRRQQQPNDEEDCAMLGAGINPFKHCNSLDQLLQSPEYMQSLHHVSMQMFSAHLAQDTVGKDTAASQKEHERIELMALQQLGGHPILVEQREIDTQAGRPSSANARRRTVPQKMANATHHETSSRSDPSFLWFGITERMQESMCLFHYITQLPHQPMEHKRYKTCRPTAYWEDRHRRRVYGMEANSDVIIFRVANALLDARLEWMKRDAQAKKVDGRK